MVLILRANAVKNHAGVQMGINVLGWGNDLALDGEQSGMDLCIFAFFSLDTEIWIWPSWSALIASEPKIVIIRKESL